MRELILKPDWSNGRRAGLERAIRDAIRDDRLREGSVLPSSRSLASDLGISRATVVGAYEQLIAEGYLLGHQGTGTTVAKIPSPASDDTAKPKVEREWRADFTPGEPDGGLFPRTLWLRSLKRVLNEVGDTTFGYCSPRGHIDLRNELAAYLARSRAVLAPPETINIVGGANAAVTLIGQMLAYQGITEVAVENPSLPILHHGMKLSGVGLVPIGIDSDGLCVEHLWASGAKAVLVTPSHQYPMGVVMSAARRAELLQWARDCQGWIIEDDYDGEFRYDRQPLGALQGLDPERVLYLGTASKALAPALRMAWLAVPASLQSAFTAARGMQSVTSTIDQLALADFISRGEMDRHLRRTRTVYHRRHRRLLEAIQAEVPWLEVAGVEAGLHLAGVIADQAITEESVVAQLEEASVRVIGLRAHALNSTSIDSPEVPAGLVFGYSRLAEHNFASAVELLVSVLARQ